MSVAKRAPATVVLAMKKGSLVTGHPLTRVRVRINIVRVKKYFFDKIFMVQTPEREKKGK